MSDFVTCLRLAQEVFEQYKIKHPKWWKRMDGTPIFNDVAVLMAQKFVEHESEKRTEIERLKAANSKGQEYSQDVFDENQRLKQIITELADALEIYGTMYPGTPLKELIQRAREATR